MYRWLLCCALFFATLIALASPPGVFSDEVNTERYDCLLTLMPASTLAAGSNTCVTLEWNGTAGDYLRVTVGKETILIDALHNGKAAESWKVESGVQPGTAYHLTVMRRGNWLGLLHDQALIFHTETPRGTGAEAGITADAGWSVGSSRVQMLQPVAFADNFMRTADVKGAWVVQSGDWHLQSAWDEDSHGNGNRFTNAQYALNPFAWVGRNPDGPSLCTVGKANWEDYTMTAAIQPSQTGAVGVVVNMPDPHHGLLVRWSAGNDHGPRGDALSLYRMDEDQLTPLGNSPGGYVPGQWYRLAVDSSLDGIRVLIDGCARLSIPNVSPWRGGVGLYAEGKTGAVFNDITVYGHTLNTDLLEENELMRLDERFFDDRNGMREWSVIQNDWMPFAKMPAALRYHHDCSGDHWISLRLHKHAYVEGQLWLGLLNDGKVPTSGYRAVVTVAANGKTAYALYRDTVLLATAKGNPLTPEEEYTLRLHYHAASIWLEVDGERVLGVDQCKPTSGRRPIYRADGAFSDVRNVVVLDRNMLDYTFANAPVDWLGQGTWMPTERWACSPEWSFLGGWSRGDAVLWHKQRFTGDQSLLAYVAPKMEYPRAREEYDIRYRDFGVTICGDGHDPRSGYAAIYGAADKQGHENQRTVLLRNGVEVASTPIAAMTFLEGAHHEWFGLNLEKRGNTIEFTVGGWRLLSYTDPAPLDGGVPAIWTSDNGLMIARARITFANPPQLRSDPTVVLDEPWYPEWADVRHPLTLDFATPWSTTGAPVQLQAITRAVPTDEHTTLTIDGSHVTFTPQTRGDHWYQIQADDGKNHSADFNLALPAFDPSLRRDDSHALLLYRFNEGTGSVVHDRGTIAPPLDLTIPAGANVQWVPGRGLTLHGQTLIQSTAPATKLMALATRKACTIEAWISTETLCPPSDWTACLLSWETAVGQQNFSVMHQFLSGSTFLSALIIAPHATSLSNGALPQPLLMDGFHTGLSHIVITWDGQQTSIYDNGVRLGPVVNTYRGEALPAGYLTDTTGPQPLSWHPEDWAANARLLLGALSDGSRGYVGTYYLLAIHDVCLSDAQIQRHYQAGPDG